MAGHSPLSRVAALAFRSAVSCRRHFVPPQFRSAGVSPASSLAFTVCSRYLLPFPKTAAKMAALRNDFLHSISRLSASSGDPGRDLLRHLSPRRFASQRTRPPASQGAGYHRESKPRREYQAGRSFSFARTTRLTEKGRTMSRSRDWLLSPARLSRRRHCRRGSPPLSRPALSPVGVVRHA